MDKKQSQERHASKRCYKRCGVVLTQTVMSSLLSQIQNKQSVHLGKQTNTRSVHMCTITLTHTMLFKYPHKVGDVVKIKVVYDRTRNSIATVLDEDMDPFEDVEVCETYADVLRQRGEG